MNVIPGTDVEHKGYISMAIKSVPPLHSCDILHLLVCGSMWVSTIMNYLPHFHHFLFSLSSSSALPVIVSGWASTWVGLVVVIRSLRIMKVQVNPSKRDIWQYGCGPEGFYTYTVSTQVVPKAAVIALNSVLFVFITLMPWAPIKTF